jgi:hypothetical protein
MYFPFASPRRLLLLLILSLISSAVAATPASKSQPVFTSETDPDFVLKLSFRVIRTAGSTRVVLTDNKARRFLLDMGATSLALTKYENGKPHQLVRTAARTAAKNELLLTRRGALLRVALNGRVLLEARAPLNVNRIVIDDPAQRLKFLDEPRLQPTEEIYLTDDFMTTPDAPSHWRAISGTWHVAGADRPQDAADPFKFVGFATGEAVAVNADTRWFWNDYQTAVSARIVDDASALGIVFAYRSPQEFYGVSWGGAKSQGGGEIKLWHRTGGKTVVLARRAVAARVGQWYRLAVSTYGKKIAVYVDENLALTASDAKLTGGQCGLFAAGEASAEFDDLRVQSVESTSLVATQTGDADAAWQARTFATDPFMAAWGNAGSEWEKEGNKSDSYWYRGHLFDALDLQISAALLKPDAASHLQEVTLLGAPGDAKQGFHLALSGGKWTLLAAGRTAASTPPVTDADLQIKIRDDHLQVFKSDGTKLLDYNGGAANPQGMIGLRFSAPIAPEAIAQAVQVKSPNLVEYRFDAAPVDWSIESGIWQSTNRWACVPNWNFYGSKGAPVAEGQPIATVWNKRGFGGDQWIEAFVAPSEGTSDWMHFAFPINLNITFGATGEVLGSGYTLVYRAQDDATILYRGGKVVAQSKALVIPDFRSNPWQVYERMTETWQHLQILRQGGRIRIWAEVPGPQGHNLDRIQLIDYTDPQPLPGDRIALWTWGVNGMSVAKLRVCAAKVAPPSAEFLKPRESTPTPDDDDDDDYWQHCVNPINGGTFRINLLRPSVPVEAPALVNFDYRSTPGTALALYAKVDDQLFRADFLGKVSGDGDAIPMGKVRISGGDKLLQHAEFPLRQALRDFFPSGPLRLKQLFLADLSSEPEQIGGLAANRKDEIFEYRQLPTIPIITSTNAMLFSLQGAVGDDLPEGEIRIGVTNDVVDPAAYSVTINGRVLPWGAPGLSWSGERRTIEIDPGRAGFSFKDGVKVELKIARGSNPVAFSHTWTMRVANDKTPPAPPQITTALGPDRVSTFEAGTDSWQRLGGEQGATLWRDTSTAASGHASLRLYHRQLAGPFGAMIRDKPFDVRRFPILTFSYRVPPSVKASLVCEIGGNLYEIAFTDDDHTFPVIGAIANVQKDDRWHDAECDLLGAVQRANAGSTVITKLFFADGGITNTVQDVAWHVDDFRFVPALPVGEQSTLRWSANDLSGIAGYSFVMDNAPRTVPDEVLDAGASAPVIAGATYLHVRAKDNAGNWSTPAHFRFAPLAAPEASTPVTVEAKIPAGKTLGEPAVEVSVQNASQLDAESVRWRVRSGERAREYSLGDESDANEYLAFDAESGVLRWRDPALTASHGFKAYPLDLEFTASDLSGKPVVDRKWTVQIQPSLDKTAPPAPFVSYIPADRLGRYDFENGDKGDTGIRRSAWVFPDASTSATGRKSARVVNLLMNDFFSAFLKKHPYSVSRYPRLEFDYRFQIPNDTMATRRWRRRRNTSTPPAEHSPYHLNLVAIVNGDMQIIKFIGGPDGYNVFNENTIGEIEDVKADGEWHHASIDFGAMLRKRYPHAPRFSAEYVGTWAGGPHGYENPQGASLWLDNITLFSTAGNSAAFEWRAPDDGNGISGYSFALDQKPDTTPQEKVLAAETHREFKGLKPGTWYFHLRARDGAGNWSATTHTKFVLAP